MAKKRKTRHQQYLDAGKHEFMLVVDQGVWSDFTRIAAARGHTATWILRTWIENFVKTGSPTGREWPSGRESEK